MEWLTMRSRRVGAFLFGGGEFLLADSSHTITWTPLTSSSASQLQVNLVIQASTTIPLGYFPKRGLVREEALLPFNNTGTIHADALLWRYISLKRSY